MDRKGAYVACLNVLLDKLAISYLRGFCCCFFHLSRLITSVDPMDDLSPSMTPTNALFSRASLQVPVYLSTEKGDSSADMGGIMLESC